MNTLFADLRREGTITPALRERIIRLYGKRGEKALTYLIRGNIRKYLDFFVVVGSSGEYIVEDNFCTCDDFLHRGGQCAHILVRDIALALDWYEEVPFWYQDRINRQK